MPTFGNNTVAKFAERHLTIVCPKCWAAKGSRCRNLSGESMASSHLERVRKVNEKVAIKQVK